MTYKTWIAGLGLAAALLMAGPEAEAATIAVSTPPGSTLDTHPVDVTATFVTGLNSISITIVNNLANPTSVIQLLSDLFFRTTEGSLDGTLDSSSGLERTVNKTKSGNTYTDGSTVSTGWLLQDHVALISPYNSFPDGLRLCVLCGGAGPEHLIIGQPAATNLYSNANGSIAGNAGHNPFLAGPVSFSLTVPGVTSATSIFGVAFSFGTTEGSIVTADDLGGSAEDVGGSAEPNPATLVLLGVGMAGAVLGGWRARRAVRSR